MTLFRQIVTVFSLFFLVMLAAVLAVSFDESRSYIEDELYTKAQNTASTLGVTMSQTGGDITKMSVIADAVFDTGYYRKIELKSMRGRTIFRKIREEKPAVPPWFARMCGLRDQSAFAQVSDGWQPLGMLEVTADASASLQYLYTLFKKIVTLFSLSALLAVLIIVMTLRQILRPIRKMEEQAKGVLQNRFIRNGEIPKAKELRRVTEAINALVGRMEQMHGKLIGLTSRNRELEYGDPLTGLNNRRFFTLRYEEFVKSQDGLGEGCALALRFCNTEEANRVIGYDGVNAILAQAAAVLREGAGTVKDAVVCRISGVEMAMLLPNLAKEEAEALGRGLLQAVRTVVDGNEAVRETIRLAAAVVPYTRERTLSELLSSLDLALGKAESTNGDAIESLASDLSLPTRKTEWRRLILDAFGEGRAIPKLRDIFSENGKDISAVVQFDLRLDGEETVPYRTYAPMMRQLGLFPRYARYLFEYLLQTRDLQCRRVFAEFPLQYLDTTHHFETLALYAGKLRKKGRELVVELGQNDLVRCDIEALERIAEELSRRGIPLTIVHFDADTRILERLQTIRPAFVRIDAAHYLDMSETLRDSLSLLLRSIGAKLLIGGVKGAEELERLEKTGSDYFVV